MVNLEYKLTVDDLIVEYMIYKVKNEYEPSFSTTEFVNFLHFFERKMKVEDILYEKNKLFERFFKRKNTSDWSHSEPHMDMEYSEKDKDYIIKANYKLSEYDRSVINTYFMPCGSWNEGKVAEIRKVIGEYLSDKPKRKIDETLEISEDELNVGKYCAAGIITNIFDSYVKKQIEYNRWPRQCKNINKYLIEMDLSEIIELKSIRSDLLNLYDILSKRIALMYSQEKNLKISSSSKSYLTQANYDLLIQGYKEIMQIAFGKHLKTLSIDLSELKFRESYEMDGIYNWDEDPDVITTTSAVENENTKKLVKNLDKLISKKKF